MVRLRTRRVVVVGIVGIASAVRIGRLTLAMTGICSMLGRRCHGRSWSREVATRLRLHVTRKH